MMMKFGQLWRENVVCHCVAFKLICAEEVTGAKLIYLPPYSPDFNPIEQAFRSIKAWLRRHKAEAVLPETQPWLIQQAVMSVTVEDAEGWIINSGYSFMAE
jgi:DDE superfamily endonuclease